jgi:hypothetical protein
VNLVVACSPSSVLCARLLTPGRGTRMTDRLSLLIEETTKGVATSAGERRRPAWGRRRTLQVMMLMMYHRRQQTSDCGGRAELWGRGGRKRISVPCREAERTPRFFPRDPRSRPSLVPFSSYLSENKNLASGLLRAPWNTRPFLFFFFFFCQF